MIRSLIISIDFIPVPFLIMSSYLGIPWWDWIYSANLVQCYKTRLELYFHTTWWTLTTERWLKLIPTYLARTDVPVSSALVCGRVGKSRPHHNISAMYTRHTFPAIGSTTPRHNITYHAITCHTVPFQAAMLSHQQGSVVERATARNWWLFPTSPPSLLSSS